MARSELAGTIPLDEVGAPSSSAAAVPAPGVRLWRNRDFNTFWLGQSLSVLGDSFALIAMPLLVLQATGSVAQMGLVTGTFGVAQLLAGIFAGLIVDRVDRRRLMILCDSGRLLLYGAIPLGWWLAGSQLWLIYVVTALGAVLGMFFQVAYITAVPNLVDADQITEANGRLQAAAGLAFVVGPLLAGLVSARFGPATAIGFDAVSFLISALSLAMIRLRRAAAERPHEASSPLVELLAGLRFLFAHRVLRWITILLGLFTLISLGAMDLFIYHLKHDLHQGDNAVGFVFGMASVGAILAGVFGPMVRRRLGFGACWIGGLAVSGAMLWVVGLAPSTSLIVAAAICFAFVSTLMGIASMSLRQQITPDHLLGRVTAAFWTLSGLPGPLGATVATALAARAGAAQVLGLMGVLVLMLAVAALFTPVRLRNPETWAAD